MTDRATLDLVVPGSIDERTGGTIYDARMAAGLRAAGWSVRVHELAGAFPGPTPSGRAALSRTLADLPDGALVVVDGLAMGALPDVVRDHAGRLELVALVHHPLADESGLAPDEADRLFRLEREALGDVTGVLVTSPFTARRLADFGVAPERIRVVVPGTEPAVPAVGPPDGEPPHLLCVGTISPRKAHDVLVGALEAVRDLDWSCSCPGSLTRCADYAKGVLAAVDEAGLTGRIDFPGELSGDALDAAWARASIFVLPSLYEGYGMALAEAVARGLPVVSTTGGAIPGTVPPDVGILVEPGDTEALASELRSLLSDDALREAIAERTRKHAAKLPTWDDQAGRFAAALTDVSR